MARIHDGGAEAGEFDKVDSVVDRVLLLREEGVGLGLGEVDVLGGHSAALGHQDIWQLPDGD